MLILMGALCLLASTLSNDGIVPYSHAFSAIPSAITRSSSTNAHAVSNTRHTHHHSHHHASILSQKTRSTSSTKLSNNINNNNNNNNNNNKPNGKVPRDIVIIGGGLAGLSLAHHIASTSSRHVTILERETPTQQKKKTVAGSFAAAGMLAPQSERLPAGPLLDICLKSRDMYAEWVRKVEGGARDASLGVKKRQRQQQQQRGGNTYGNDAYTGEGAKYLWELVDDDGILASFDNGPSPPLEPWEVGFHSTGGFLAPAFAGDAVATWSPQPGSGTAYWLDEVQVRELEPMLHPQVVGGWWFPEDASVDARRLTCSLRASCVGLGVQMLFGEEYEVKSLEMGGGKCRGVHLANGKIYSPNSVIVANGSWMRHLLPIPVTPHKGQSFSLRMPSNTPPLLSRVLFAQDTYIVPKADGRIIVGATVEPGKFDGDVTPSGMMHCLSEATRLIPGLGDLPIEESWAGLRPTTPDKCPILGKTPQWENVYLAGGYWRNGVLLAPKTGQLVGDLIMNGGDLDQLSEEDQTLLKAFSWERFTIPGGGKALAANARYAATFYPVHKRSTSGVSTSVGTELGFYEGAAAATDDRAKDRKSMFGLAEEEEAALERAAGMGRDDAQAFSFGNEADGWMVNKIGDNADLLDDSDEDDASIEGFAVEADPDAYTVAVLGDDANKDEPAPPLMLQEERTNEKVDIKGDLPSLYEKIKANKAKGGSKEMGENPDRERPDPGFRIHFVDPKTRELTEVPPYTSPGEFHQMKAEGKLSSSGTATGGGQRVEGNADTSATSIPASTEEEGKPLFDGYQTIREAYGGGTTDEETAEYTRQARMKNRGKSSEIDESKIGATRLEDNSSVPLSSPSPPTTVSTASAEDLSSVNNQVQSDKAQIDDGSDEKTFDGYQEIMNANSSTSREDELQRMKEARMRNRVKASQLDDLFQ